MGITVTDILEMAILFAMLLAILLAMGKAPLTNFSQITLPTTATGFTVV